MAEVGWSEVALNHLREIVEYLEKTSPKRAVKVHDQLFAASEQLVHNPRLGRRVPEFKLERLRELIVRPYRVLYVVEDDTCTIVAVIHSRRDMKKAFRLEDLDNS